MSYKYYDEQLNLLLRKYEQIRTRYDSRQALRAREKSDILSFVGTTEVYCSLGQDCKQHNKHQITLQHDDEWVTINGTHTLIGENGTALSGGKLKGMTFSNAKSQKSKSSLHKATISAIKSGDNASVKAALQQLPAGAVIKNGQFCKYTVLDDGTVQYDYGNGNMIISIDSAANSLAAAGRIAAKIGNFNVEVDLNGDTSEVFTSTGTENSATENTATPIENVQSAEPNTNVGGQQYKNAAEEKAAVAKMSYDQKISYLLNEGYIDEWYAENLRDKYSRAVEYETNALTSLKVEAEQALSQYGLTTERGHLTSSEFNDIRAQIVADTGASVSDALQMYYGITDFTGFDYGDIRERQVSGTTTASDDAIEKYISLAPKWNGGTLYRGISVSSSEAAKIISSAKSGDLIDQRGTSSWTSKSDVATDFSKWRSSDYVKIIFRTPGTNQGVSVKHLSENKNEDEVLISRNARWVATSVTKSGDTYTINCNEV